MTYNLSQFKPFSSLRRQRDSPDLPLEYSDLPLSRCPPTQLEQEFAKQFPGHVASYQHPNGLLILRHVRGATRKLHKTRSCLTASGFKVSHAKLDRDAQGRAWQSYLARNPKNNLQVKTIILDHAGNSWATVEEWFWHAILSNPCKTYLAISDLQSHDLL